MEGYIKLYRKLLENPIFQNEKLLKVFIWCLLKASHREHEQLIGLQKITLQPGQFIYGRLKASKELKIKESTVNKYMRWLKDDEIINIKSNNKFSVITIVNWALYQLEDEESNSKSNNNVTTKEQQRNTNKNVKNDKNEKKYIKAPLEIAFDDFEEMRKKIKKPLTPRAKELVLKKLDKLADDDETKIKILEQSTMNSWQGVFALKDERQNNTQSKQPPQATNFKQREYSPEFYEKLIGKK